MTLADLGWNDTFEKEFAPFYKNGWVPARLIRDNKITYGALMEDGAKGFDDVEVVMSGKVYHDAESDAALPAVGDWVALDVGGEGEDTVIRARLSRQTCLSRKAPGNSAEEQVIVANVSTVVVVTDAGPDFNLRRMERYFAVIARSGAKPVVLVNKSDLYSKQENEEAAEAIRELSSEVDVHVTNVKKFRPLRDYFKKGQTIALIGSSGVGKSALVNAIFGDEYQWTGEVNELTGKGRHTTTARELMVLRKGGILVDNPGIKEIQMWTDETTLRDRFVDVDDLAAQCKFLDCKHGKDTGCAIRAAVEAGTLDAGRYEAYMKLDSEIAKLRAQRKKRQMTIERRAKRDHKIKARNPVDRRELEHDLKPRA
ncbi:ribosome small subunit-dependent GTPase A [Roseimicrobium sp. ORNL1]|uniref:ribosome small subunit-dependent GTPase A n=1 Tax=Roseimicrobium sp. ORNL1 TaxID=2711231 RepID=UPI0013E1AA25|nr:ribosome small subunit-dependent GTPase A [Roseimicrobium sp. ORNL1]QIF02733.1 ribosome small subunit-dependent GTPase A [Roseimicrobium sp. ORNL1]